MADEHYEWLDEDAAEKLLRGEPVDPVAGHSCTEAERLAAALDAAARAVRPATGELPGEAAALAAFRSAAHSAGARTRAANPQEKGYAETGEPASDDVLGPVRMRPASGGFAPDGSASSAASGRTRTRTRSLGWSRPIRFGLVASFAGCALGGVAVAASTGMLPGPFGERTPVPASSVSAAATPEELGSGEVTGESPSAQRSASPRTERSTSPADPSAPTGDRDSDRTGKGDDKGDGKGNNKGDDKGDSKGDGDRKPDGTASGSSKGAENGKRPDGSGNGTSGGWYAKTLKACQDYRNGRLDEDTRRYLEALAKGARNLDRFCDHLIDKGDNGQNSPGHGNGSDGEQDDDGDSNGDRGGSHALPAIRLTAPPLATLFSPGADRASVGAVGSAR
ncbi:hypothetical protein [Streptomyces sp. NPDC018000]|uniref:hypothetical protein n=1 Tax=Streptomyces sp. NPDC018000 TaxID=3365028 RepID=UPI00379E26C3